MEWPTPVPCSDDVPTGNGERTSSVHQTGVEVPGSAGVNLASASAPVQTSVPVGRVPPQTSRVTGSARGSGDNDMATDAEVIATGGPSITLTGQADSSQKRDKIEIKGSGCTISAEGLASVLKPGGVFQLGVNNQMTVVQNKGGDASTVSYTKRKNKFPLTQSQAAPEFVHLDLVSSMIAGEWRRLGRLMGLDDSTLDQLKIDYSVDGQHEINYRMLLKWQRKCTVGQFTFAALSNLLVQAGRGDIADEFRNC